MSSDNDPVGEFLSGRPLVELINEKPAVETALLRAADLDGGSLLSIPQKLPQM